MSQSIERRLARIEALEHIRILKARYCDLCDEGYPAGLLAELFTEDGTWDGGEMGVHQGRDAVLSFFNSMPQAMSFAIHHVTNSAIEVNEDATAAQGRWYLLQTATLAENNEAVWLAAHMKMRWCVSVANGSLVG
jgi:hypothetical protein